MIIKAGNDKVVKNIVKKVGAHPLSVDEINFFRDDNTILHFKNPEGTSYNIQLMLPSRITLSSLVENLRLKPSRNFFLSLSSNLDANIIHFYKISYLKSIKLKRLQNL